MYPLTASYDKEATVTRRMAKSGEQPARTYKLALQLQYKLHSGEKGTGESISIDLERLAMRCSSPIPIGEVAEVDIAWPLLASGRDPLVLRIQGVVAWSDQESAIISIGKSELVATNLK
jgi:hypothetical protein